MTFTLSRRLPPVKAGTARAAALAGAAVLLGLGALDVYRLALIPVPWFATAGWIALWIAIAAMRRRAPGLADSRWLLALLGWGALVTAVNAVRRDYASLMPPLATTPYELYVALRFAELAGFIAALAVVRWLLANGARRGLLSALTWLATAAALAAVYVYLAQVHGWPDIPRNRLGTLSTGVSRTFSYAVHRAIGTFREPSLLAEWLIVPLFLSFAVPGPLLRARSIAIGTGLFLTSSLTGIYASLLGGAVAILLANPLRRTTRALLGRIALNTALSVGLAWFLASPYAQPGGHPRGYVTALADRMTSVAGEAVRHGFFENRDYIVRYMLAQPPALAGTGMGHANIELSQGLHARSMCSFLNLYLCVYFSCGVPGLILLLLFLGRALWPARPPRFAGCAPYAATALAATLSYLLVFLVHTETLTVMSAVAVGCLLDAGRAPRRG